MFLGFKNENEEDFRTDQFWQYKLNDSEIARVNILNEILRRIEYIDNGQLIPPKEDFFDFINSFQDFCYLCTQKLTELIGQNHVEIICDALLLDDISGDHRIQFLNLIYILTKDIDICQYLYENKRLFGILFNLYNLDHGYFIQICNIFSRYLQHDIKREDIYTEIVKTKIQSFYDDEEISFFKEILKIVNDIDFDDYDFAHAALFLISNIIPVVNLKNEHLHLLSESLTNRLIIHRFGDKEISDIVYCFCCLINKYPTKIIFFSNTKIIGCFPFIFAAFKDDSKKFVRFSMYLMNLLYIDGTHINYFAQAPEIFLIILDNMKNFTNLTEKCVLSALKALFYGIQRIPHLSPLLLEHSILDVLCQLNEVATFTIKEVLLKLLSLIIENADPSLISVIINHQCYMSILADLESYSSDLSIILLKSTLFVIQSVDVTSINEQFYSIIETLSTTNEDLGHLSQKICEYFLIKE